VTDLSLAAQRILVQDPAILESALVGSDAMWPVGWVFPDKPGVVIENTQLCAIVLWEDSPWTDPNPHNTVEFATLVVDIWADPTRNPDKSIKLDNAQDKIKRVAKTVTENFHLVEPGVPAGAAAYLGQPGMARVWGTPAQVAARSGIVLVSSVQSAGPQWNPMSNNPGGVRGRYRFNVSYISR